MIIGDRLRVLREQKKFSQGEIEKRTGLLRCYISRVENGHTVPAVETLEKFARALEVPLYQLFYDGDEPPKLLRSSQAKVGRRHSLGRYRQGCPDAGEVPPVARPGGRRGPALAPVHGEKDGEDEAVNGRCARSASGALRWLFLIAVRFGGGKCSFKTPMRRV